MAKCANAGELNTPCRFMRITGTRNKNGYISGKDEVNVFEGDAPVWCKWVNLYGSDVWENMSLKHKDPATITTRYSPKLADNTLIVYKGDDPKPFEVVGVNDVENRHEWLEIKVQRMVSARKAVPDDSK